MADGSGYVDPENVLEGTLIKKAEINATADAWNYVEERVSDINIREEGLSRVNFDAATTWAKSGTSNSNCYSSIAKEQYTPKYSDGWSDINFGSVSGGIDSTGAVQTAKVQFDWEPQRDTYAIIRASFRFNLDVGMIGGNGRPNSDVDCTFNLGRSQQKFRFGLLFHHADETSPTRETAGVFSSTYGGAIYSPVQIHLNPDFAETANGKRGPIRFKYDRRSNMTGTISLLAAGQSWENEYCSQLYENRNGLDLREPGPYVATIVWRGEPNVEYTSSLGASADGGYSGTSVLCEVGNMNLFVQTFRR